jgi:hypothetical protein
VEVVIGVLVLFSVLFFALSVILGVRAARAIRRGVEHTGVQVRRTVEESALKARSTRPGPMGELARSRLELRSSVDGARRALEAGVEQDPSLREALGLLGRLREHAHRLDGELQLLMEREPDKARVAERMPDVRERVAHIKESADSLRFAAQDRVQQHDAEGLAGLREQIEIESDALRHWQGTEAGVEALSEPAAEQASAKKELSDKRPMRDGASPGRASEKAEGASLREDSPRSAP